MTIREAAEKRITKLTREEWIRIDPKAHIVIDVIEGRGDQTFSGPWYTFHGSYTEPEKFIFMDFPEDGWIPFGKLPSEKAGPML